MFKRCPPVSRALPPPLPRFPSPFPFPLRWVRDKLLGRESEDIDVALDNMMGRDFADIVNTYLQSQVRLGGHYRRGGHYSATPTSPSTWRLCPPPPVTGQGIPLSGGDPVQPRPVQAPGDCAHEGQRDLD